jgi:hypothetical protein
MRTIFVTAILLFGLLPQLACNDEPLENMPDGGQSGDVDSDSDSDTDVDSDADSDSDSDSDSDTHANPCPDGQHAGCYGEEVWCLDSKDTPKDILEACDSPKKCVELSDIYAECTCEANAYNKCHNGDVWTYNSCDEFEEMKEKCASPFECVDISETEAGCCEENAQKQCGSDGNVHWIHTCTGDETAEGDVSEDCTVLNESECKNSSDTTAECGCKNHWEGANCDVCPLNWDPDKDCAECSGYWDGADCDNCSGFGDNCQCPDSTFAPQPDTRKCWTCKFPKKAENGICSKPQISKTKEWDEAMQACAEGFRLPTLEELVSLLDNCSPLPVDDNTRCDNCSKSELCNQIFTNSFTQLSGGITWTADECADGAYIFYLSDAGPPFCRKKDSSHSYVCISK